MSLLQLKQHKIYILAIVIGLFSGCIGGTLAILFWERLYPIILEILK